MKLGTLERVLAAALNTESGQPLHIDIEPQGYRVSGLEGCVLLGPVDSFVARGSFTHVAGACMLAGSFQQRFLEGICVFTESLGTADCWISIH